MMRLAPRTLLVSVGVALLLVQGTLAGVADHSRGAVLECGSVITSDTTLAADVGPCNDGDGLVVAADDIKLNLNGHRVFSTAPLPRNAGTYIDPVTGVELWVPADVVGIRLDNVSGVTVHSGTVEGFSAGVSIEGGGSNTVRRITAQANQAPCIGEDFSTQAVGTYGDGIVVFGSQNNRIQNNVVRNNGPFSGIAVVANLEFITIAVPPFPSGNVIHKNVLEDNNLCFGEIGIRVEGPGATDTVVSRNKIRRSFLEGIAVHPVNVIDFRPLFRDPPECQNRGFPSTHEGTFTTGSPVVTITDGDVSAIEVGDPLSSEAGSIPPMFLSPIPAGTTVSAVDVEANQITMSRNAQRDGTFPFSTLPLCPIQDPLNPPNDHTVIRNNLVTENGFGGPQINAGPNTPNAPSAQSRAGIQLLAFCGYGSRNGANNVIRENTAMLNAGDGIAVGGCPVGQNPAAGTFPGFTDNQILSNTSVNNNQRGCGRLPAAPGCGARPTTPRFDLRDATHQMTCPSTSPSTQAVCAALGFPPPPAAPAQFVGTPVVQPGGTPCDANAWSGNKYATAFPSCTTAGGERVKSSTAHGAAASARTASAGPSVAGRSRGEAEEDRAGALPLRGWHVA